jgi:outer membrane protein
MKLLHALIGISLICSLSALGWLVYAHAAIGQQKMPYVDSQRVFSEFEMSKELKAQLETAVNQRKYVLDSLKQPLGGDLSQVNPNYVAYLRENIERKEQEFTEANQALAQSYDQQIWTRINQYAKEFGQMHGYEYVFGADGTGTLMYANSSLDLTDDFVRYINQQYTGR